MNRPLTLLLTLLLSGVALAGCTTGDDADADPTPTTTVTDPTPATPTVTPTATTPTPVTPTPDVNETPTLGADSYTLETVGIPAQIEQGKAFNYTLHVNGTLQSMSNHVGAHFRNTREGTVDAANMTGACPHPSGNWTLGGTFNLTCTFDAPGTYYVYGHARVSEANETFNYWSEPAQVKVRNFTINLTGVPSTPQVAGQNFTFTMTIAGSENTTSNHIGAHFWNATQAAPSAATAGACSHSEGATLGTYTVTCDVPTGGAASSRMYVRGHLRITEGGAQTNFWSAEHEVTVLGNLL